MRPPFAGHHCRLPHPRRGLLGEVARLAMHPQVCAPVSRGPLPKRPSTERVDAPHPTRRPTEAYPLRYGEGGQRSRSGCSGPRMPGSEEMVPWRPASLPEKLRSDPPSSAAPPMTRPIARVPATGDPMRCGGVDEAACFAKEEIASSGTAAGGRKVASVAEGTPPRARGPGIRRSKPRTEPPFEAAAPTHKDSGHPVRFRLRQKKARRLVKSRRAVAILQERPFS
jgi:hypothetical protein